MIKIKHIQSGTIEELNDNKLSIDKDYDTSGNLLKYRILYDGDPISTRYNLGNNVGRIFVTMPLTEMDNYSIIDQYREDYPSIDKKLNQLINSNVIKWYYVEGDPKLDTYLEKWDRERRDIPMNNYNRTDRTITQYKPDPKSEGWDWLDNLVIILLLLLSAWLLGRQNIPQIKEIKIS